MTIMEINPADAQQIIQKHEAVGKIQFLMVEAARAHFEIGRHLVWLKENCQHGEFNRILEEQLNGLSYRGANQHMLFFRKIEAVPQLKGFGERNFSKALILFHAVDDEELQQVADGEHPITIDNIDTWPVRKLREELKKLKKGADAIVAEETKGLREERDAAIKSMARAQKEIEALKSERPDAAWWRGKTKEIQRHADAMAALMAELEGREMLDCPSDEFFRIEAALVLAGRVIENSTNILRDGRPDDDGLPHAIPA